MDENHSGYPIDEAYGFNGHVPFLDEEKGCIYLLQNNLFNRLDLNTQKANYIYDSRTAPLENQFYFESSTYIGNNLIYFMGSRNVEENSYCNYIGLFDTEKIEVVWHWRAPEGHTFGVSPTNFQASENKLYALDRTGTLHIFEKE